MYDKIAINGFISANSNQKIEKNKKKALEFHPIIKESAIRNIRRKEVPSYSYREIKGK